MINHIKRAAYVLAAVWGFGMGAAAEARLSPALGCLEKKLTMDKCGIVSDGVTVSVSEIDAALGRKVSLMRVEALPDETAGRLYIDALPAAGGQTVTRASLDTLFFEPATDGETVSSFALADLSPEGVGTVLSCRVSLLDHENLPPQTEKMTFETAKNVSAMLYLPVSDPEGDDMTFSVSRYPKHGTLTLPTSGGGYFRYTPKDGYTGRDSFSYTVSDVYGHTTPAARVEIKVSRPYSETYFEDMKQHWAQNAALKVSSVGLMKESTDFMPDGTVNRGDFLAMALICAGKEKDIGFVRATDFADDDEIPMRVKSYAAYAKANGIVNGIAGEDGRICFCSDTPITRAEAAVIVSRILKPDEAPYTVDAFADGASVPDYAAQAMANVYACGIMKGVGGGEMQPTALVTRAQTAQILCEIMERV